MAGFVVHNSKPEIMYNKTDYIRRGARFLNNQLRPCHKKLSSLYFYTTTLCDSQCKHCLIWQKRPITTMDKNKIVEVMHSKCITKHTTIGLEGGEFLLHPEAMDILLWFKNHHANFDLLSNCLKPEKVIEAVKKSSPRRLYVSLDGDKNTYRYMRGKDGFDKVIQVVEECKDKLPVSLMFTLSPYNDFDDMKYVIKISQRYNVDIRIGIYNNINFFDTQEKAHDTFSMNNFTDNIPHQVKDTTENYDFLLLYDEWRKGNLNLKCHSIKDSLVIHPNGDVPLCQNLDLKLGNIYENSLDEIFNSYETKKIHQQYSNNCNNCWINFHRKYDIVLLRSSEQLLPKKLIQLFYGEYNWTSNKKITYKNFLNGR